MSETTLYWESLLAKLWAEYQRTRSAALAARIAALECLVR
jgi:hypothetical protein